MQLAESMLRYLTDIIYKNRNDCTGHCFKLDIKMSPVTFLSVQGCVFCTWGFLTYSGLLQRPLKCPPAAIVPREGLVAR